MAESKIFRMKFGMTIEGIGREVENFLRNEKELTVEGFASADGYFVQAKESSTWKSLTGMGKAIQVQILPSGDSEVVVNIGTGKWADKAGAAAVGILLFAPLAFTAAFGAYKQHQLPAEIFACIEKYIIAGGLAVNRNVSAHKLDSAQVKCPSCGAINSKSMKFCAECGSKLANTCPNCGASVPHGQRFCSNCGASMNSSKTCSKCGGEIESGQKFCPQCGTPA